MKKTAGKNKKASKKTKKVSISSLMGELLKKKRPAAKKAKHPTKSKPKPRPANKVSIKPTAKPSIAKSKDIKKAIEHKPKSPPKSHYTIRQKAKIETGMEGLDSLLSGGINSGSSLIIYGTPHCGKKPLMMQIAYSALKQKIPVIFILADFGARRWKDMMNSSGWDLDKFENRVYFVDAYSQQYSILKDEENITYLQVPFPLSTLSIECTKYIETCELVWKTKPLIVFHSLSTLIQNFGESEVFNFLQFFLGKLSNDKITSIYSMQSGMHSEKIETMTLAMMDGVFEMRDTKFKARGFMDLKTTDWIPYTMSTKGVDIKFKSNVVLNKSRKAKKHIAKKNKKQIRKTIKSKSKKAKRKK